MSRLIDGPFGPTDPEDEKLYAMLLKMASPKKPEKEHTRWAVFTRKLRRFFRK